MPCLIVLYVGKKQLKIYLKKKLQNNESDFRQQKKIFKIKLKNERNTANAAVLCSYRNKRSLFPVSCTLY